MVEEMNLFMIYLIHCNSLCKCCSVSPPSSRIQEKGKNMSHTKNRMLGSSMSSHNKYSDKKTKSSEEQ
jgi:hypothetical protein